MTKAATEFDHMAKFAELVTAEVFGVIVETAIVAAKAGDAAAREWISLYAMGRPKDAPCRLSGISLTERQEAQSNELFSGLYPAKAGRGAKK